MSICNFDVNNGESISNSFGGDRKSNKHLPNGRINVHTIPDPALRRLLLNIDENVFKIADGLKETSDLLDPISPQIKKITPYMQEIASKVETLVTILEKVESGEWHSDDESNSSNCTVVCKVTAPSSTSNGFMSYYVDLYENGVDAAKTGSGKLYIAELALGATIPIGTYILGHKHYVTETGGNE